MATTKRSKKMDKLLDTMSKAEREKLYRTNENYEGSKRLMANEDKMYKEKKMREARAKSAAKPKKDSTVKSAKSAVKGRMGKAAEAVKKKAADVKKQVKTATSKPTTYEKDVREARQRSRGTAGTKSGATPVTRNAPTNARGGNKPLLGKTAAQVRSQENYLKRIKSARTKDQAAAAAKAAAKAGLAKGAVKAALKAVPIVGAIDLAIDAYKAVEADGKRTSKGGQMQRSKASSNKKK